MEGQSQLIVVDTRGCCHIQGGGASHSLTKTQIVKLYHNSYSKNKTLRTVLELSKAKKAITKANATVLEKVAEVVKHRTLILTTDATEIAEKAATVCHHSRESDFLLQESKLQT